MVTFDSLSQFTLITTTPGHACPRPRSTQFSRKLTVQWGRRCMSAYLLDPQQSVTPKQRNKLTLCTRPVKQCRKEQFDSEWAQRERECSYCSPTPLHNVRPVHSRTARLRDVLQPKTVRNLPWPYHHTRNTKPREGQSCVRKFLVTPLQPKQTLREQVKF